MVSTPTWRWGNMLRTGDSPGQEKKSRYAQHTGEKRKRREGVNRKQRKGEEIS